MRVALGIEYDGTDYVGWQRQKSGTGVQALVEDALGTVADQAVQVVCAGRTDAGVHASGQVVHFDTRAERSVRGWILGANSHLPHDINVVWASPVDSDFHARFSATCRMYRYCILNQPVRSALVCRRTWWVHGALDAGAMQTAAAHLVGRHDFSAFRAAGCQASSPVRQILELSVQSSDVWIDITVRANAFLQHMVRNIAGVLVTIGRGERDAGWAADVLNSRDREKGGVTAPPQGLTLIGVEYPARCGVPENSDAVQIRL